MSRLKQAIKNIALKTGIIDNSFIPINQIEQTLLGSNLGYAYQNISDETLINESVASNTHLYSIISRIKNLSMNGKYKVMLNTPDGMVEDQESDLYELLQQPNDKQNFQEWLDSALTMLLVTGDVFLKGDTAVGFGEKIMSLETLPSNIVEVLVANYNNEVLGYDCTLGGRQKRYSLDEVYHGMLYNPTIYGLEQHRGLSPLQAGYRTLTADNELTTAEASFYKNKGVSGILSSGSDIATFSPEEAKQLDDALKARMGGAAKANGVITTGANVNYQSIGMSPSDLKIIESGDIKLRNLCMLYGLDSKLFGDPKASTYNNQSEVARGAWNNSVIPFNNKIVSYLNTFVTANHNRVQGLTKSNGYEIVFDTSHIQELQKDKKVEAEKNKIVIEGITSLVSSNMSDDAKVMMLTKLYEVEEDEAQILIETNGNDSGQTNEGANQEAQGENQGEENNSNS
jgi:HK97 family phage portal protein